MKKISIYVVFLFILTLYFANDWAYRNDITPLTNVRLNIDYDTHEEYFEDFNGKSYQSGYLLFNGFYNVLTIFPEFVQYVRDIIDTFSGWVSDVWDFLSSLVPTTPEPPTSGGGGGGGFRTR